MTNKKNIQLGVVIVTYNRKELLKECIEACFQQTVKFSKIIVVNNNSTDGTKEYLDSLKNKNLIVIHSKENLGGAGGFHLAIKEASSLDLDYLLIIDDDAIIDKKYNEYIIPYMNNDEGVLAFSGVVKTDGNIQFEHRRHMNNHFKCVNSSEEEYKKEYFDYELATFCGLYVSTKIIKKIGLPKKEFFIWFDDTEYSIRILEHTKIRNINKAELNHKTKIAINSGYNWKSYYSIRNQIIILKQYFSKFDLFRFKMNIYIHILYSNLRKILCKSSYYGTVSKMYSDALKDGLNETLGKNEKYIPSNNDIFKK